MDRLDLEKMNFHKAVYDGYIKVSNMFPDRFVSINGNQNREDVFNDCMEIINKLIK